MKPIAENEKFLTFFSGNNSLLDGKIEKIEIFNFDEGVTVNVNVEMRRSSKYRRVQLRFSRCSRYFLSYSSDYYFYNIESIKLFRTDDGLYYISFDPMEEVDIESDDDQDFIVSEQLSAYDVS